MFHQWGEVLLVLVLYSSCIFFHTQALGIRLSDIIQADAVIMNEVVTDEFRQRELLQEDEEEDV